MLIYKCIHHWKTDMNDWQTGDLILFKNINSCFGKMMKFFTGSEYTHVGIILKNPQFTYPPLVGLYFWESCNENYPDAEDHKKDWSRNCKFR